MASAATNVTVALADPDDFFATSRRGLLALAAGLSAGAALGMPASAGGTPPTDWDTAYDAFRRAYDHHDAAWEGLWDIEFECSRRVREEIEPNRPKVAHGLGAPHRDTDVEEVRQMWMRDDNYCYLNHDQAEKRRVVDAAVAEFDAYKRQVADALAPGENAREISQANADRVAAAQARLIDIPAPSVGALAEKLQSMRDYEPTDGWERAIELCVADAKRLAASHV